MFLQQLHLMFTVDKVCNINRLESWLKIFKFEDIKCLQCSAVHWEYCIVRVYAHILFCD